MIYNAKEIVIKISPYAKVSDLYDIVKENLKIKRFLLLFSGNALPKKDEPLFYFGIKNNDKLLIYELYLNENVDIELTIIVTNDNHPKFNINN